MPGSLDSCINNIYEPGNIPSSPGLPPVRVLLKDPIAVAVAETAAAIDAPDVPSYVLVPRQAMLPGVFVNSDGTPRQANVNGIMVNL